MISQASVPLLPISDHALLIPLIGSLDSARLQLLQQQVLREIERSGAQILILDVTGIPIIDTQVARGLLDVVQATRLLGAEPLLVGIRPEVAQSLVQLGLDLSIVRTLASLQRGISYALGRQQHAALT
ncbi:MAG: STAS domain-containing protein [Roseiflexaceae bacterium]|nr:STAS domain-containing protein [Roseiflexaceae bacterium]